MPYSVQIYSLHDPVTLEVRYIGKTKRLLRQRLAQHIYNAKRGRTHKDCWIRSLAKTGLKPLIQLIETSSTELWEERERFWIRYFKQSGRLVNVAAGGGTNSPKSGADNHKATHSREFVREAVSLYVLGFSLSVIQSLPKFSNLSSKTLRTWAQKEARGEDTVGIPTRREFLRSYKNGV